MLLCLHCRRRRVDPQDQEFCLECLTDLTARDEHYWWDGLPSSLDPEVGTQCLVREDFQSVRRAEPD